MTNTVLKSYLTHVGYEILDEVNGVYRLRRGALGEVTFDGAGLFVTIGPLDGTSKVYFCVLNAMDYKDGPKDTPPAVMESIMTGWQLADARRLIESGILFAPVNLPSFGRVVEDHVPRERPNGMGTRYISVMESGDVICHN